jgi:hypothetical protein
MIIIRSNLACSAKTKNVYFDNAIVIGKFPMILIYFQIYFYRRYDFVFVGRLVLDKGGDLCIIELLNKQSKRNNIFNPHYDGPENEKV